MDSQSFVYMAYDGDNAGRLCGRAILADNPNALHEVSERIQLGHEIVKRWVESHGGQFISGGGDEGVFSIPEDAIHSVEELRADYKFATNLSATVGIGKTLSEAGKAMLVGKFRGKDTVVQYDPGIEQEIKQAQSHLSQGTASAEEKKIGEAYLQDEGTILTMATENKTEDANNHSNCPYCADMKTQNTQDPDHCPYCHDMDTEKDCPYCHDSAAEGHPSDCPYCAEAANHDASASGHPEDCPYCAKSGASKPDDQSVQPTDGPAVKSPTTTDSENYSGQDLNQPDLPKPDAIQQNPDGLGFTQDTPTNENIKLDVSRQGAQNEEVTQESQGVDPQSEETIQGIAEEVEEQPADVDPDAQSVNYIDAADTASGTRTEGNVSRPENYDEENNPRDMGLAEEDDSSLDVTGVMQEGLDSHADNIQRERIVNLVAEALTGFKACKSILEKSKVQAPQLYESSIAMLKAMIEMAKMLGLDQEAETGDGQDPLSDTDANPSNGASPDYESSLDDSTSADSKVSPEYEQAGNKEAGKSNLPKTKGQSANQ